MKKHFCTMLNQLEAIKARKQPLTIKVPVNSPEVCGLFTQISSTVGTQIIADEAARNAYDALAKAYGADRSQGMLAISHVGGGAIAFVDDGIGMDAHDIAFHFQKIAASGNTADDEMVQGTSVHFGIGIKMWLKYGDLTIVTRKADLPIYTATVKQFDSRRIGLVDGIKELSVGELPDDVSWRKTDLDGRSGEQKAPLKFKSIREHFESSKSGTYLILHSNKKSENYGLLTKSNGPQEGYRTISRWLNGRYMAMPRTTVINRGGHTHSVKGTSFEWSAEKAGLESLTWTSDSDFGQVVVHAAIGAKPSSRAHVALDQCLGLQVDERVVLDDFAKTPGALKGLFADKGLRRLAAKGRIRMVIQVPSGNNERAGFGMSVQRGQASYRPEQRAITAAEVLESVQIDDRLLDLEEAMVNESVSMEVDSTDFLKQFFSDSCSESQGEKGDCPKLGGDGSRTQLYRRGTNLGTLPSVQVMLMLNAQERDFCQIETEADDAYWRFLGGDASLIANWEPFTRRSCPIGEPTARRTPTAKPAHPKNGGPSGEYRTEVTFTADSQPVSAPFVSTPTSANCSIEIDTRHQYFETAKTLARKALAGKKSEELFSDLEVELVLRKALKVQVQGIVAFLVGSGAVGSGDRLTDNHIMAALMPSQTMHYAIQHLR